VADIGIAVDVDETRLRDSMTATGHGSVDEGIATDPRPVVKLITGQRSLVMPAWKCNFYALHELLAVFVASCTTGKRTVVCAVRFWASARLLAEDSIVQHLRMTLADACMPAG
jgi:hypothetical protein